MLLELGLRGGAVEKKELIPQTRHKNNFVGKLPDRDSWMDLSGQLGFYHEALGSI